MLRCQLFNLVLVLVSGGLLSLMDDARVFRCGFGLVGL